MEALAINREDYNNLEKLYIGNEVCNTESEIFLMDLDGKQKIFKSLYATYGEYFKNKLYTINSLIDNKEKINMDELIMPERLVIVDENVSGYIMNFINGKNLKTIMNDKNVNNQDKINYLKQVGNILDRLDKKRKETNINIYLNDIHDSNFLVNDETNNVNVLDMDSAKIGNNIACPSKYLRNSELLCYDKYEHIDNEYGSIVEPSKETELYCYTIMILNMLYGADTSRFVLPQFYNYIEYLSKIGIPKDIIDNIVKLFSNDSNVNLVDALDDLTKFTYRSNNAVYKLARNRM